jgi:hypothetical protein
LTVGDMVSSHVVPCGKPTHMETPSASNPRLFAACEAPMFSTFGHPCCTARVDDSVRRALRAPDPTPPPFPRPGTEFECPLSLHVCCLRSKDWFRGVYEWNLTKCERTCVLEVGDILQITIAAYALQSFLFSEFR